MKSTAAAMAKNDKTRDRGVSFRISKPRFDAPMRKQRNLQSHAIRHKSHNQHVLSVLGAGQRGRCPTHQATRAPESFMLPAYLPTKRQRPGFLVPEGSGDSEERGCCCEEGGGGEGGRRAEVVAVLIRADA